MLVDLTLNCIFAQFSLLLHPKMFIPTELGSRQLCKCDSIWIFPKAMCTSTEEVVANHEN